MFGFALWDTAHARADPRARPLRREAALLQPPGRRGEASGCSSPASSSRCSPCPDSGGEIDADGGARLRLLRLRAHAGQHLPRRPQAAARATRCASSTGRLDAAALLPRSSSSPSTTLDEARGRGAAGAACSTRRSKSRLVSDVPFGAFLCGGLDSSVVVALMARHLQTAGAARSRIGFREAALQRALRRAPRGAVTSAPSTTSSSSSPTRSSSCEQLVWYLDEPFADSSAVPTYLVAKLAREQVKMVLTGDGGDEAFAGYGRYLRFLDARARRSPQAGGGRRGQFRGASAFPGRAAIACSRIAERLRLQFPESYLQAWRSPAPTSPMRILGDAVARPMARGTTAGSRRWRAAFSSLRPARSLRRRSTSPAICPTTSSSSSTAWRWRTRSKGARRS